MTNQKNITTNLFRKWTSRDDNKLSLILEEIASYGLITSPEDFWSSFGSSTKSLKRGLSYLRDQIEDYLKGSTKILVSGLSVMGSKLQDTDRSSIGSEMGIFRRLDSELQVLEKIFYY